MGQKVNPHGLRVGVIKDWDSRWYASKKDFGATLAEDYKLRQTLKKQLYNFGISKIEIERDGKKVKISIHTAKPGLVIGKGGAEIEKLKAQCEKMLSKPVAINIVEVKAPELDAQLTAESIAAARKENFLPPRYEAEHRQRDAQRREGYQDHVLRPSRRRGDRAQRLYKGEVLNVSEDKPRRRPRRDREGGRK